AVDAALVIRADLAAALAAAVRGITGLPLGAGLAGARIGDPAGILDADLPLGASRGAALAHAVRGVAGLVAIADDAHAAVLGAEGHALRGHHADLVRLADHAGISGPALAHAVRRIAGQGRRAIDAVAEALPLRLFAVARRPKGSDDRGQRGNEKPTMHGIHQSILTLGDLFGGRRLGGAPSTGNGQFASSERLRLDRIMPSSPSIATANPSPEAGDEPVADEPQPESDSWAGAELSALATVMPSPASPTRPVGVRSSRSR